MSFLQVVSPPYHRNFSPKSGLWRLIFMGGDYHRKIGENGLKKWHLCMNPHVRKVEYYLKQSWVPSIESEKYIDLVIGLAEKWCSDTKSFLFFLGWSDHYTWWSDGWWLLCDTVLGSPVFISSVTDYRGVWRREMRDWTKPKTIGVRLGLKSTKTKRAWMG